MPRHIAQPLSCSILMRGVGGYGPSLKIRKWRQREERIGISSLSWQIKPSLLIRFLFVHQDWGYMSPPPGNRPNLPRSSSFPLLSPRAFHQASIIVHSLSEDTRIGHIYACLLLMTVSFTPHSSMRFPTQSRCSISMYRLKYVLSNLPVTNMSELEKTLKILHHSLI